MSQYFLLLKASTWALRAFAWAANSACWPPGAGPCCMPSATSAPAPGPRGRTTAAPWRRRQAACPPGSWTTRSGRTALSAPALCSCSWKSTCRSMPAASTTRRSWTSPHCPRALLDRRADSRAWVDRSSCSSERRASCSCWASCPYCSSRSRSSRDTCCCTAVSFSATGARARSTLPSWFLDSPSSRFCAESRRRSASAAANWALTSESRAETASKSSSSGEVPPAEHHVDGGGAGNGAEQAASAGQESVQKRP